VSRSAISVARWGSRSRASIGLAIAAAYDLEAFRTVLRTGVPLGGRQLRTMDRVARRDFSHLTDEEIAAIHAYLVEWTRHAQ